MGASAVPTSVLADLAGAARGYVRLADGVEAALLTRLAATAVTTAEAFCGTLIVQRTCEDVVPVQPGWQRLAAAPVTAIAGVTALPAGAAPAVLPVDAYAVDIDAGGDGWVRIVDAGGAALAAVSYTAGHAATFADVLPALAQGMVLLAAHLFEHREGDALPPAAVAALWRPFRAVRLAERVRAPRLARGGA